MNYEDTMNYIHGTLRFGSILGLSRIEKLLEILDNPHKKLKCIHIAGTNGKGSTTAMISEILTEAGYKVGMYTSPYIEEFEERIQINRQNIPKEKLCVVIEKVKEAAEKVKDSGIEYPTEFEIVTCAAFLYFYMEKVDYAVIEVGLGGRFDATNVITPILSVITSISYDHMKILGDTIDKIAYEKSGIIKDKAPVILYPQVEDAYEVIKEVAKNRSAELIEVSNECAKYIGNVQINGEYFQKISVKTLRNEYKLNLSLLGIHQLLNSAVAIYAAEKLMDFGINIKVTNIENALMKVKWKGRLEILKSSPLVVIDGAHNIDGIVKLKKSIHTYFKFKRIILILGILADKEINNMVREIAPEAYKIITVSPKNDRAETSEELCDIIKQYNSNCESEEDYKKAYEKAVSYYENEDMILVCGSLYMIGYMRKIITYEEPREVGIIKWFGGYNPKIKKFNDFGFIVRKDKEDLYFNKNHIHCNVRELVQGRAVSFEEGVNFKNGRLQAMKVKLAKNESDINVLKSCIKEEMFKNIDIYDKLEMLWKLDYNTIVKDWNEFSPGLKVLYLYRICKEDRDFSIIENINEKNKIIRAMLLLIWGKYNSSQKNMAFEKALKLMNEYKSQIIDDNNEKKEIINYIIPSDKKGVVDVLKPLNEWSILELIESCNGESILRELNKGDLPVVKLIYMVNSYTKI
ncbi:glutamate ligase domain-containing protein [Clostridium hydrogenum]|uniref:glutamate ligase domain-containing protein n=1 Tax=Clostridium hydrogenum TaxID=2855764 RepID=UPI002E3579E3|nr:Mur ligase family protein [Clostridium hydrogenum]